VTLAREHGLSPAEFRRRYVATGRPVVLTGIAEHWPAVKEWSPDALGAKLPDARVRYVEREMVPEGAPAPSVRAAAATRRRDECSLSEFVARMDAGDGFARYVIVSPLVQQQPSLQRDLASLAEYQFAPWVPARVRRLLDKGPLFWMGPADLSSPLHLDIEHNLFVQIHGRKDWLLLPPDEGPNVYFPWREHPPELLHWSPVDPDRPDLARFPRYAKARPLRVTLHPGEILFVPAGWWHVVRYPEPAISVNHFWLSPWASSIGCRRLHIERLRRRFASGGAARSEPKASEVQRTDPGRDVNSADRRPA
jgi:jumonji domain-containing protein 7